MSRTVTQSGLAPTQAQIDYAFGMKRKLHLADSLLNNHCLTRFGVIFNQLDRARMSALIDEMKDWTTIPDQLLREAGQQDLWPGELS